MDCYSVARAFDHLDLAFSEPDAEHAPASGDRHRNETDARESQPHRMQPAIRPGTDLITNAVSQSVGYALLTLYLSSRRRTVNKISRERSQQRIGSGPPRDLEDRQ